MPGKDDMNENITTHTQGKKPTPKEFGEIVLRNFILVSLSNGKLLSYYQFNKILRAYPTNEYLGTLLSVWKETMLQ